MPSEKTIGGSDDAFNTFFSETGAGKARPQMLSSSIWSQLSSMRSELELTDNCSTPNNSSPERKMLPTTSPGGHYTIGKEIDRFCCFYCLDRITGESKKAR